MRKTKYGVAACVDYMPSSVCGRTEIGFINSFFDVGFDSVLPMFDDTEQYSFGGAMEGDNDCKTYKKENIFIFMILWTKLSHPIENRPLDNFLVQIEYFNFVDKNSDMYHCSIVPYNLYVLCICICICIIYLPKIM